MSDNFTEEHRALLNTKLQRLDSLLKEAGELTDNLSEIASKPMITCPPTEVVQPPDCTGVLDCSRVNWRFFERNADGSNGSPATLSGGVPQLDGCIRWNLYATLEDCEGNNLDDQLTSATFMRVTAGSEAFDPAISVGSTNGYNFLPDPNGGPATFSIGPANQGGDICSFQVNVIPCEAKRIDFGADQPVGSVTAADLEAGIGNALDYQTNVQLAEIANGGIRQVIPTNGIDPRFLFESTMPDSRCYELTQTVLWETNPADFGGATNFQTTKLGYGLASATPLDGGQVDPSRFSIRFVQFNGEWKLYSYFAERPGNFGEYLDNGAVVPVTPGTPQVVSMTLCMNTGSQDNGTIIATVDGVVIHQDNNVVIQTSDHNISSCIYGTFFGGSGTAWAPSSPQTVNIYDVSYVAIP